MDIFIYLLLRVQYKIFTLFVIYTAGHLWHPCHFDPWSEKRATFVPCGVIVLFQDSISLYRILTYASNVKFSAAIYFGWYFSKSVCLGERNNWKMQTKHHCCSVMRLSYFFLVYCMINRYRWCKEKKNQIVEYWLIINAEILPCHFNNRGCVSSVPWGITFTHGLLQQHMN